jgi:hypothetical protein
MFRIPEVARPIAALEAAILTPVFHCIFWERNLKEATNASFYIPINSSFKSSFH